MYSSLGGGVPQICVCVYVCGLFASEHFDMVNRKDKINDWLMLQNTKFYDSKFWNIFATYRALHS